MAHAWCVPSTRVVFPAKIPTNKPQRVAPTAVRTVAMASASTTSARLEAERCVLFVCDVQEKFAPVIHGFDNVVYVASAMLRASALLNYECIITEQVPDKLGKTVAELQPHIEHIGGGCRVFSKTKFSMVLPENEELFTGIEGIHKKPPQAMLVGLESHVCVQQTALDLLERGWEVFVLVDGVSSQRVGDCSVALRRMENAGCVLSTSESALFEMTQDATHPKFRDISKLVREPRPQNPLPAV
tara:strand:+ start:3293 stop:4021 length:729 start_codon:yes stop_codon:yes gene_type:complete